MEMWTASEHKIKKKKMACITKAALSSFKNKGKTHWT